MDFPSLVVFGRQLYSGSGSQVHARQLDRMMPMQQSVDVVSWIRADQNCGDGQDQYNDQPCCDDSPHASEI